MEATFTPASAVMSRVEVLSTPRLRKEEFGRDRGCAHVHHPESASGVCLKLVIFRLF